MGGGRKNLMREAEERDFTLEQGQSIMQVLGLRGSNSIEVMDAKGEKLLALFPAKFQKSMWMKRGNFVVVDESAREEAAESGMKVGCTVVKVLFHEQVKLLQKSPEWPEVFRASNSNWNLPSQASQIMEEDAENSGDEEDDDDDGLPPLEANTNRVRPPQSHEETDSESESDS